MTTESRTPKKPAAKPEPGTVALVGAGPGDPELLTLRAATVLGQADVVFAATERFGPVLSRCREGVELVDTADAALTDAELVKAIVRTSAALRTTVMVLACNPGGDLLATGVFAGRVSLNDPSAVLPIAPLLPGQTGQVNALAFSADGRFLAGGSLDGMILIWEVATRRLRARLLGHASPIQTLAFSEDGSGLSSCDESGNLRLWDVNSPEGEQSRGRLEGLIHSLAVASDGRIAAATEGNQIWEGAADRSLAPVSWGEKDRPASTERISSLAYSADGSLLASGLRDGAVVVRESATGRIYREFAGIHPETFGQEGRPDFPEASGTGRSPCSIAFSPDASLLAVGHGREFVFEPKYRQVIRVWSLREGREVATLEVGNTVPMVYFTRDGRSLIAACRDGTIRTYRTSDWKPSGPEIQLEGAPASAAVSPDESSVAVGLRRGTLELWDRASRRRIGQLQVHNLPLHSVAFSPDGRNLAATMMYDRFMILCETATLRELLRMDVNRTLLRLAFTPKGDGLIFSQADELLLKPAWPLGRIDADRAARPPRDPRDKPAPLPPEP